MSQVLKCEICGKDFIRRSMMGTASKRCPDCRLEVKRERARRAQEKKRELRKKLAEKRKAEERLCIVCQAPFTGAPNRKYCIVCSVKMANEKSKERKKAERERLKQAAIDAEETKAANDFMAQRAEIRRWRRKVSHEAREAAKVFDNIINEAEAAGMSYGKYQALLRQRKMNEDKDMEKRGGL